MTQKELEQENAVLKEALEIMLDELKGYARMVLEDYIVDSITIEDFIEPAKESLK